MSRPIQILLPRSGAVYLHGGALLTSTESNREVFESVRAEGMRCEKVLVVPFAAAKSDWALKQKAVAALVDEFWKSERCDVELASIEREVLSKQLGSADIAIIPGGSEVRLQDALAQIGLAELRLPPLVIGASAGANFLCNAYYSNDREQVEEGIGAIPCNLICHFTPDKKDKLDLLASSQPSYPTYGIAEQKIMRIGVVGGGAEILSVTLPFF